MVAGTLIETVIEVAAIDFKNEGTPNTEEVALRAKALYQL